MRTYRAAGQPKIKFQWETAQKPPDFLYFDLTDPMVTNLADYHEELTKRKWLFYRILTLSVLNLSYILPSEYYATKSSGKC